MEIERKFLITKNNLPHNISNYPHFSVEQAYIITNPVLRIRKKNEDYILTYKGSGLMMREELEVPIPKTAYEELLQKVSGNIIRKTRYLLPEQENLTIELDIFSGILKGLYLAEVEFPSEEVARKYQPPTWFDQEVTNEHTYHNSNLSQLSKEEIQAILKQ